MLRFLLRLKMYWLTFWNAGLPDLTQEAYPPPPKEPYTEKKPRIRPGRDRGVANMTNVTLERFYNVADGCIKRSGVFIPEPRRTEICHAIAIDIYTQMSERLRPILCEAQDVGNGDSLEVTYSFWIEEWKDTVFTYHGWEPACDC